MEEKKDVRDRMKYMRGKLPADDVVRFGAQICERLLALEEVQRAKTVFLYAAVRGEADLTSFAQALLPASGEKTVPGKRAAAFPRVQGDEMDYYEVFALTELVPGAFRIPEPPADAKILLPTSDAIILVPGVAFMENGNRIGMGKGYYDRYLSRYPHLLRVGIAYEMQLEAEWEPDAADLPMDMIVTERRTVHCHTFRQE